MRIDGVTQLGGGRYAIEMKLHGPDRRRRDGQKEILAVRSLGADHEHRRPSEMGERRAAEGEALRERARGEMDAPQQLTGTKNVSVVSGHEVNRRNIARLRI